MKWLMILPVALGLTLKPLNKTFDKQTYFAADLPSEPFISSLKKAEKLNGGQLKTRGEFHLTIVTPPEYLKLSEPQRKKLQSLLAEMDWAKEPLTLKCIGRGQKELQGQMEHTYFVVVEAPKVRQLREAIGLKEFYSHVTLGFTKRDLHFEDGVKKDISACVSKLP